MLSGNPGEIETGSAISDEVKAPSLADTAEQEESDDNSGDTGEVETASETDDIAEAAPVDTTEGQSSSNCFSLLLIIGVMGSVGVVVRQRNG